MVSSGHHRFSKLRLYSAPFFFLVFLLLEQCEASRRATPFFGNGEVIRLENFITHFGYVCGRSGHPFS
jgi:hypothetical protein